MAITISRQPATLQPIHSPMMFLISSTNTAEKNAKVVFSITVGSDNRRVKVSPRPIDGKFEFDISSHLRDYLDLDEFNPTAILTDNTDYSPHVNYQVVMWDEYISATTGSLVISTTINLPGLTATNIVLNRSQQLNFSESKWINVKTNTTTSSNLALASGTRSTYLKDDVVWIHSVGLGFGLNRKFKLREYDKQGVLLVDHAYEDMSGTDICQFYKLDLSTYIFNANTYSLGFQFYEVDVLPVGEVALTLETRTNLIDVECSSWEKYRLVYLDKYGSYNTMSLNYKSTEDLDITKENYRSRIDSLTDRDSTRGLQNYFTMAKDVYTLNTGNLNADDMAKFEDLLLSTRVLLDVRTNSDVKFTDMDYVPLIINTNKMKRFKSENQELAQYTIECELAYDLNVRRR